MAKKTPKPFHHTINRFKKFRLFTLTMAETFDAWRIIPRVMLIAYAVLVVNMYSWYKSIPTYVQEKCDAAVITVLIQNHITPEDAQKAGCSVQNVVGGPTSAQTALVTTIIGLSSLIFGFYTNSGRRWDRGMPDDLTGAANPAISSTGPPMIVVPAPTPPLGT